MGRMELVVDASVVIKWLVDEDDSEIARQLLVDDHALHAPMLMAVEVGNALVNKVRRGLLSPEDASMRASRILDLSVNWTEDVSISEDAVRIALELNRGVYDCLYLALAHRVGGLFVTADARFANAVASTEHSGAVVLLGTSDLGQPSQTARG